MTRHHSATVLAGVLLLAAAGAAGALGATGLPAAAADNPAAAADNPAGAADTAATDGGDRCLVVELAATGEPLLAQPASNGTTVALAYTHSVEKTRVLDGYRVQGDRFVMTRMEFESYGAGLPATVSVNRTANGSFVFDPDGSYEELYVEPGRIAGHVLHVEDRSWSLVALSNASTVRLHVAPDCPTEAVERGDHP